MLTSSPDGVPVLEPKNLVRRRFVMTLGVVAIIGLIALLLAGQGTTDRILGSGSTFAQPLIQRAATGFQDARAGDGDWVGGSTGVDYEPVGSLGGVMRLQDPEVDFAVADYPLSDAALQQFDAVQFPIAIGSISAVYNLGKSSTAPLRLSPATLSGIFSGRIASWADPAIAADNPGVRLPATGITVVYRQDGSGTTLNWSNYLARTNADWRDRFGSATTLRWPTGIGVKGSGGMAKTVAERDGAIGYLETGQAKRAGLATAALQSSAGQFVEASEANVTTGARELGLTGAAPTPPSGKAATSIGYPVVTASYIIMKRRNRSPADNERTLRFLSFLLDKGSADARALGYLPLSQDSIAEVRRIWSHELKLDLADGPKTAS